MKTQQISSSGEASIIVLNYQHWQDTINCVASLFELKDASYNIIIIDNNSTNESYQKLYNYCKSILNKDNKVIYDINREEAYCQMTNAENGLKSFSLLKAKTNKGYAAGNNIGLKYAREKFNSNYYWILNNDTKVHPNALFELIKTAMSSPKIGLWGTTLLEMDEPQKIQSIAGKYNKWTGQLTVIGKGTHIDSMHLGTHFLDKNSYPIGASLMVTKLFLDEVGLMNELYFLYYEELDWQFRGREKGWISAIATRSWVWHRGSGTVARTSPLADYFGLRSRLLWAKWFAPYTLITLYLCLIVLFFNRIRRGQFQRIKPLFLICFNPKINYNIFFQWAKKEQ